MFDINNLITPNMQRELDSLNTGEEQALFLLQLIDPEKELPEYAPEVLAEWKNATQERYDNDRYSLSEDLRVFVIKYAHFARDIEKIKMLINNLLSVDDGVYDVDTIIGEAEKEMVLIDNIADFEFSDSKAKNTEVKAKAPRRTSIKDILKYKNIK